MQVTHHHQLSQAAELASGKGVAALDSSAGSGQDSSSTSSTDNTSITANDFLSLLVAEMKNQDPTADTDPNAYIDQLVQVNSLQQLIQINQDLTPPSGSSGSSGSDSSRSGSSGAGSNVSPQAVSAASRLSTSLAHAPSHAFASRAYPAQSADAAASSSVSPSARKAERMASLKFHRS